MLQGLFCLLAYFAGRLMYAYFTKVWKKRKQEKELKNELKVMKVDFDRMLKDVLEKRAEDKDDCECENCRARRARNKQRSA